MSATGISEVPDDGIIRQLNELFGNVLQLDLIKSVAKSCSYDILESSNKLLEISQNSEKRKFLEDIDMNEQTFVRKSASSSGKPSSQWNNSFSCSTLSPKKSKKVLDFEAAVDHVNKGYKVIILMRGLPGSGKSTLAKKILEHTVGFDNNYQLHILSTDDYFYQNPQNVFQYDVRKIEEAHNWNHRRTFQGMSRGFSPIIIDNTNIKMWEMKAYATMAIDYGYFLHILEPDTHWCFNDKELTKRNKHGVPRIKIKEMLDRYEKNITPQKLLSAYNLSYKFQKPPQIRLYPPLNVSRANVVKSVSTSALSNKTNHIEAVNLMDFDDVENSLSSKSQPIDKKINNGIVNAQNTVDDILMFNGTVDTNDRLKQTSNSEKDIFEISDDDEDNFYSRIERDWGIKESSLKSWDIVTPITNPYNNHQNVQQTLPNSKEDKKATSDNSMVTEEEYFRLLNDDKVTPGFYGGLTVLETVNRDINHGTPKKQANVLLKLTLDKGCMTDDVYEDYENHISELESLFPFIPKTHLTYWYNKCKGDLEWTIEFLLEAKDESFSLIIPDDEETINSNSQEESSPDTKEIEKCNSHIQCNGAHKHTKRKLKKSEGESSPDDRDEVKKILESKFDIGGEHYSKHLLRVKNYMVKNDNVCLPVTSEPSTSKTVVSDNNMDDEIISIDSDFDFEEVESETSEKAVEESIELNLGEYFVSQLEKEFADPNIQYPKGFQPVVQMPITLAKQLYSFYIESVYQQMENQQAVMKDLLKEDEEFARKLQAKEQQETDSCKTNPPQSFKEIQEDQQAAKRAHEKEMDKWKHLNPDNLAAKLTRQKLFSIFPTIPQETLVEVLLAHNNKYLDTVETLLASTKSDIVQGSLEMIKEPPLRSEILDEMKEAQKNSACEECEERQEATIYREEASKYLKKRTDLYQKAYQYYQRGMMEVAQFYSGLASLQTTYYDRANNMAATAFLDEHSNRLQDFNTLDLHYLYVKEAKQALDVFLDRNINLLKHSTTKQCEFLQIITGRGKRSENGTSKIKPVVMSRLRERNIKYMMLNPGLLRVKINKTSLVTSEFLTS